MSDYISREAAIAYIREQSEELQKAFEELGGESGIYADAYNDLAEDFHRIPAVDAVPVIRCKDCKFYNPGSYYIGCESAKGIIGPSDVDFCSYGEKREKPINSAPMNQEERWLKTV